VKHKIILTETDKRDFADTANYISENLHNKSAAIDLITAAKTSIATLINMPTRHPLVEDAFLSKQGFRLLPVGNYLIFYVVDDANETVVIHRFLYSRRDWINILSEK
jgi:addiction module RelE/StbE family toxin